MIAAMSTHQPTSLRLGVLDSGVGGLSVLPSLLAAGLPTLEAVHYLADTAWMPYGDKAPKALGQRIAGLIDWLAHEHRVDAVVLACNTATTVALIGDTTHNPSDADAWLATGLAVPVVSPVFPTAHAVAQQACQLSNPATGQRSPVLVLATDTLLSTGLYNTALHHYSECPLTVTGISGRELAVRVEAGDLSSDDPLLLKLANEIDQHHGANGPATLILGCTHYPHVWPLLAAHMQYPITSINPAAFVPQALATRLGLTLESGNSRLQQPPLHFWATDAATLPRFQTIAHHLMPELHQWANTINFAPGRIDFVTNTLCV